MKGEKPMARKKTASIAETKKTPQQIIDSVNLAELARKANMDYALVYQRIKRGWDLDKALSAPARKKAKAKKKVVAEKTPAEAKAIAKEIRNTLEANTETVTISATSVSADTNPKPGTIVPNLGTPLISEKAEKSMGMLWFLVLVLCVIVVGVWLQEAGVIGWADRIVE
jgi:MarR-like DNA-binding transcriptional regulator SgrR of sgrS sRNA